MACALMFASCNDKEGGSSDNSPYFIGQVVEVYEAGCLMEVTDGGTSYLRSGDPVVVNTNVEGCPEYAVGDLLKVVFDGAVAESYPMQIHGVLAVSSVDAQLAEKGNDVI